MAAVLWVGAGGFLGAVGRYLLGLVPFEGDFPLMTFLVNFAGAVAIGAITEVAGATSALSAEAALFLKTGVCGGFTTFSTFCNENIALLRGDNAFVALLYIASSMFCGLLAVMFGYFIIDYITKA